MYSDMKRYVDTNGYVIVYKPEHPKAMKSGVFAGFVYEHVLMAEEQLDRAIREGEHVHHFDENKSNNSPDNLLVLEGPQHSKLHRWMEKNTIHPNEAYAQRKQQGCLRCARCEKPINPGFTYCSPECYSLVREQFYRKVERPSKEVLEQETALMPMTTLGAKYGVSDTAVRKWCQSYGIELPDRRGYWAKVKADQKPDSFDSSFSFPVIIED